MVNLKSESEIKIMIEGAKRLKRVVSELMPQVKAGVMTLALDEEAEQLIKKFGGQSSFKRVKGYSWSTCISINEEIVHTPPSKRIIKTGDVVTIDIGIYYQGFHVDYADTVVVGPAKPEVKRFLEVGKSTLQKSIEQAIVGNYLGDISKALEMGIEGAGYFIARELTGHGVGRELHEEPFIPGYLNKDRHKTMKIVPGLVIAIEAIYSVGSRDIMYDPTDEWSILSADRSLSACFEHTVAITRQGSLVIT